MKIEKSHYDLLSLFFHLHLRRFLHSKQRFLSYEFFYHNRIRRAALIFQASRMRMLYFGFKSFLERRKRKTFAMALTKFPCHHWKNSSCNLLLLLSASSGYLGLTSQKQTQLLLSIARTTVMFDSKSQSCC